MDKKKARRLLILLLSLTIVMTVFANLVVGAQGNPVEPSGVKNNPQPNHQVVAVDDPDPNNPNDTRVFTVKAGQSITISVLENDTITQSDHNSLKVQGIVTQGQYGTAVVNSGNLTITYTANPNCDATADQFQYSAGVGQSPHNTDTAWVYIVIEPNTQPPQNRAPIAHPFTARTQTNQSIAINIVGDIGCSDPDGDHISIDSIGSPQHGTTTSVGNIITYTPNNDFHGTDSFAYTILDSKNATASATITIVVSLPNPEPPTTGHLTVQKQLQGGGDNDAEFRITIRPVSPAAVFDQEGPIYISVNQAWQRDLLPGTYQVTEADMPEGYYFEDISHKDGMVTIVDGEEYTITIVNRYEKPQPEPEEPAGPEEPTQPKEPTKPQEPVDPEEPSEPEDPIEPEEPTKPEKPVTPEEPTGPTKPEQPMQADPGTLPKTSGIDATLLLGSILTLSGLWLSRNQR